MKEANIMRKMINLIPSQVRNGLLYVMSRSDPYAQVNKSDKKIIVMLGADYGNLGDVAITESQLQFLKKISPFSTIIEMPISRTYRDMKSLMKKINNDDIITLVGGGNTGSLYPEIEAQRRFIIAKFPSNKIIAFPQSVFFGHDTGAKIIFKKSKYIYSNHPDFTMLARDKPSYEVITKDLNVDSRLLPDIVLSNDTLEQKERKDIAVISLRSDIEASLSHEAHNKIASFIKKSGLKIKYMDTDIKVTKLSNVSRASELKFILDTYLSAKIVITDRLHGMIFCVITGTPCIAFDNNNGKVLAAYDLWVRGTSYIRMVKKEDVADIEVHIKSVIKDSRHQRKSLKSEFDILELLIANKNGSTRSK